MDFKSTKSIFQQIADSLCDKVLSNQLKPGNRVPSVRDMAEELGVNRNTVMRTYTLLHESEIFTNQRGVGFFVSSNALEKIQNRKKKEFFEQDLPEIVNKIKLLKLNSTDLEALLTEIKNNDNHENQ